MSEKIIRKKSLGQNFLKSTKVLEKIIDTGDPHSGDIILEIGPGNGVLTERLLIFGAKVIAIEKDHRLIPFLQEKFSNQISEKKLDLLERDILDFDPVNLKFYDLPYKIISNIPYYITGQILKKFLQSGCQPQSMTLLVQDEVAKRIIAKDGKESLLSISVKAYGDPKYIMKVNKSSFDPSPKVDSAILHISNIGREMFHERIEKQFFNILKAGFAHKRKFMINNLEIIEKDKSKLQKIFNECGFSLKIRAEDLEVADWFKILDKISQKNS